MIDWNHSIAPYPLTFNSAIPLRIADGFCKRSRFVHKLLPYAKYKNVERILGTYSPDILFKNERMQIISLLMIIADKWLIAGIVQKFIKFTLLDETHLTKCHTTLIVKIRKLRSQHVFYDCRGINTFNAKTEIVDSLIRINVKCFRFILFQCVF